MDIVKIENLKELIIEIRGQSVLLDSDVAELCGVCRFAVENFDRKIIKDKSNA